MKTVTSILSFLLLCNTSYADIGADVANKASSYDPEAGDCYAAVYEVVQAVYKEHSITLDTINSNKLEFALIWGTNPVWSNPSYIKKYWLKQSMSKYRASGPPGAMAHIGRGTIVNNKDIWSGNLKPGALIQGWDSAETYKQLHKGVKPENFGGHAFIFLKYTRDASGKIKGMKVYDHNNPPNREFAKNDYGLWIGCNLK